MGTFKVPSPTPSPTSSQHSSRSRRSQRSSSSARRSPGGEFKVPSVSSSSSSGRHSQRSRDGEKSPGRVSDIESSESWAGNMRKWLGSYANTPEPDSSAPPPDGAPRGVVDLTNVQDDASSDASIGSNIVIAQPRAEPVQPAYYYETMRKIWKLIDHDNITLSENRIPRGTPAEFRDAGTLQALIRSRNTKVGSLADEDAEEGLPEKICWHVLLSLLRAVHYLHTGNQSSEDNHVRPYWQPIVHNAIHPANIYFQSVAASSHEYKPCKLGNFSRCVVLPRPYHRTTEDLDEQFDRREAWNTACTLEDETGFEAPEVFDPHTDHVPGPYSDLWSIGAVMVAMMTKRTFWDLVLEEDFIRRTEETFLKRAQFERRLGRFSEKWQEAKLKRRFAALKTMEAADIALALPERYGDHLKIIVEGLLFYEPAERRSAWQMLHIAEVLWTARVEEWAGTAPKRSMLDVLQGYGVYIPGR